MLLLNVDFKTEVFLDIFSTTLAGNNSHPYQFCCGEIPNPKERKKINYPVSFLAGFKSKGSSINDVTFKSSISFFTKNRDNWKFFNLT